MIVMYGSVHWQVWTPSIELWSMLRTLDAVCSSLPLVTPALFQDSLWKTRFHPSCPRSCHHTYVLAGIFRSNRNSPQVKPSLDINAFDNSIISHKIISGKPNGYISVLTSNGHYFVDISEQIVKRKRCYLSCSSFSDNRSAELISHFYCTWLAF